MKACLFVLVSMFYVQTKAQEKIDTDRPDQTESAALVPRKYFQGEFGFSKENFEGSNYNIGHPSFLLKYGLSKRFELRLESAITSEFLHLVPSIKRTTQLEPAEIGTKISLFEEKSFRPKTSLIVHLGFPFAASNPDKEQNLFPSYRFSFQHTISKVVGLGYNIGSEWDGFENRAVWLYTLASGFNFGEKWYGYFEVFGFKEDVWQHAVDGGFAYYVNSNAKLDLSTGFGLRNDVLKNYVSLGFSIRIPLDRSAE